MSAENNRFAAPRARDIEHIRRIKVAPLLAAGLSVRAISTETGIPVGAVHRVKRQLEKEAAQGRQNAAAIAQQLPTSYVVKQDIGGVPQDVRRLMVAVYEQAVERAIGRGLLGRADKENALGCCERLVRRHVRRSHNRVAQQARISELGSARPRRGNHRGRQCSHRTAALSRRRR
jgi:hypothetical protein